MLRQPVQTTDVPPPPGQDIPGSESIGRGYNVFRGRYASPYSTSDRLVDLTEKAKKTIDERHTYNIPLSVDWQPVREGRFEIVSGRSVREYASRLMQEAGLSGEYMGFKASLDASFTTEDYRRSESAFVTVRDVITRWELRLDGDPRSILLPSVEEELHSLDAEELFDRYGTHYLKRLLVGAKATVTSVVKSNQFRSSSDLRVAAEMSYKFAIGQVGAEAKKEYQSRVETFHESASTSVRTLGGDPALARQIYDGGYDDWSRSTDDRPGFVDFAGEQGLRPIWELCKDSARRGELQRAYVGYADKKSREILAGIETPRPRLPLVTGDVITLQADTGAYLSRMGANPQGVAPIEATKSAQDPYTRFKVTVLKDGKIALRADNDAYVTRMGAHGFAAAKTVEKNFPDDLSIDRFSRFQYTDNGDGTIVLRGDTGQYVSRWGATGIQIHKDTPDPFCRFRVDILDRPMSMDPIPAM